MQLTRNSLETNAGPDDWFTGTVYIDTVAAPVRHDRFPCFDGVRALAALMVVVYHSVFFNTDFLTRGGSFFGTRGDMAEALAFAADGKIKADIELQPLSAINDVLTRLDRGDVASRVVIDFSGVA